MGSEEKATAAPAGAVYTAVRQFAQPFVPSNSVYPWWRSKMQNPNPAEILEGETLQTGWRVLRKTTPSATGGSFSVGYLVEEINTGQIAYLKAMDFSSAFQSLDFARELQNLTTAFNFERDILRKCGSHGMKRVLTPICDGVHKINSCPKPLNSVHYLVFEKAEGDLRSFTASLKSFNLSWCLRSLHHTATGIMELHLKGIVHQDLKPSNVLTFDKGSSKLADLGRAFDKDVSAIHDNYRIPGDKTYASPELLYNMINIKGIESRRAADLYALGNLLFFHFSGLAATQAMLAKLKLMNAPIQSDYKQDLVYWQRAFDEVLIDLEQSVQKKSKSLCPEIILLARELCEPDPDHRGDPKSHSFIHQSPYSVERYVSRFDLLARKAEMSLL